MSTVADSIRKIFEEIARAPQDAQKIVNAIIGKNGAGGVISNGIGGAVSNAAGGGISNGVGSAMKFAANVVTAALGAAATAAHQRNVNLIMKFIILQIFSDSLAMIRMHPTRMGINEEVTRRFMAATEHAGAIAASLNQLFESGGLGPQTEVQVILAQQVAFLKSQLRAAKAADDMYLHYYDVRTLDQV